MHPGSSSKAASYPENPTEVKEGPSENLKLGTGLLVLGFIFLLLGTILLFDRALLALGDLLFLTGIVFTIGLRRTAVFFFKKNKIRGNICFFGGIFLVLFRWAIFGMIFQVIGFLNLFGPFIPIAVTAMRQFPIIGDFLNLPGVSTIVDKIAGSTTRLNTRDTREIPV